MLEGREKSHHSLGLCLRATGVEDVSRGRDALQLTVC